MSQPVMVILQNPGRSGGGAPSLPVLPQTAPHQSMPATTQSISKYFLLLNCVKRRGQVEIMLSLSLSDVTSINSGVVVNLCRLCQVGSFPRFSPRGDVFRGRFPSQTPLPKAS